MKPHLPLCLFVALLAPIVSATDISISSTTDMLPYQDASTGNIAITDKDTVHISSTLSAEGTSSPYYKAITKDFSVTGNTLVHFFDNSAAKSATVNPDGSKVVNLKDNDTLLFTNNTATSSVGGVMGFYSGAQTDISGNGLVSFVGNTAVTNGGVYHDNGSAGLLTFSGNGELQFLNNKVTSQSSAKGGVMYVLNANFVNNDLTTFSGNKSNYHGGAICIGGKGKVNFICTDNSADIVRFNNNYARTSGGVFMLNKGTSSAHTQLTFSGLAELEFLGNTTDTSTAAQSGGVFYANSYAAVALNDNENISFSGNCSSGGGVFHGNANAKFQASGNTKLIFTDNHAQCGGGGVFAGTGSTNVSISGNGLVEFSHNSATGAGGVILGGTLSFTNNEKLLFRHNTAGENTAASIREGGAIYFDTNVAGGHLTISGNKQVEFRGNAEGNATNGWLLRSIYAKSTAANEVRLCATNATDSITFYDSVYVGGSLVTKLNEGGAGRITFSGKYAATDLAALGGNSDVTSSQTSVFDTAITIQGGVLEVADGAILNTPTLTTASGATTELNSGKISGALVISSGGTLSTTGSNAISSVLSLNAGSLFNVTLGAENLNTAALSTNSLSGFGNAGFSINTGDLIDGKYLVLTTNNGAGAMPANVSGLSWEGNNLYLTVSGSDNVWHVRENLTYGTDIENSASQKISLDGGTMRLTKNLSSGVALQSTADSTLALQAGVALKQTQISGLSHNITLTGEGTYQLGNSSAMQASLSADNWKGEVYVGDTDSSYTAINALDLAQLGNRDSSIRLQGVSGSLASGSSTVEANLVLAAGSNIAAIVIATADEGDKTHFSGDISSAGAVNFINDATTTHSYEFSGDVSRWSGQIVGNAGTMNLTYSGEADTIATDIRLANTGSGSTLNLRVENNRQVIFNGAVADAPTWGTQAGRQMNLEIDNAGNETIFRKGVKADSIRLSNESTLIAQAENSSARISISSATGCSANISAVDVTDSALALHSGDTTATRGSIKNAAIVLGEETAIVALLSADADALADTPASYTISNIDFANTRIAALSGTMANVSGVSLDADSALLGDGSGYHLLQGSNNTVQLTAGNFVQDAESGTYTYTTSQLLGFTLASGAALSLDADLLSLPVTEEESYTLNILLQGFNAQDVTPNFQITHAAWESYASAYSWSESSAGAVISFTVNTVPEPTSTALSLVALAALALRRRRS